jgi:hypothetical protein
LIGIEILERGAGRAIDELLVELPDAELVSLMIKEITEVDGVDVEDVRAARELHCDPKIELLRVANELVNSESATRVVTRMIEHVRGGLESLWVVVVDLGSRLMVSGEGAHPSLEWILAFVEGASYLESNEQGPHDLCWTRFGATPICLVASRTDRPYRAVEREEIFELAAIAGSCLERLVR